MEQLTIKQGLMDYDIDAMCQDRYGMLWIGTGNGLQKFDGLHFTNFQFKSSDTNTISSNDINCILEDSRGRLWTGTENGLNLFVREKNTFRRFDKYRTVNLWGKIIVALAEDNSGNICIGTQGGGLYFFNPATEKFTLHSYDPQNKASLSSNYVSSLVFNARTNVLYAGTRTGLNVFDYAENIFFNPLNPDKRFPECTLVPSKFITRIQAVDSALWISLINGELFLFDHKQKKARELNSVLNLKKDKSYEVYCVMHEENNFWISSYNEPLRRWDVTTGKVDVIISETPGSKEFPDNSSKFAFRDRNDIFWIGSHNGLNYFNLSRQNFEILPVANQFNNGPAELQCVTSGKNGNFWIGTYGSGMIHYNAENAKPDYFFNNPSAKFYAKNIWSILKSAGNFLWIGTSNGLLHFNPENMDYEIFPLEYKNSEGTARHDILNVYEDRHDTLWIMTWDGPLLIFDKNTKKYFPAHEIYGLDDLKNARRVTSIVNDRKNRIWIGSLFSGLFCWDKSTGKLTSYKFNEADPQSISSDLVMKIIESSDHTIWVGTQSNYLNYFNEQSKSFVRVGEQSGIPDVYIQTIAEDHDRNLWIGTRKGICRFNPGDSSLVVYDVADGLPENWIFSDLVYDAESRSMAYASNSALVSFNTNDFKESKTPSPVVITNIKLYDRFLANAEASPPGFVIELNPKDNFVSIEYAAIDFLHPNKIRYYYKLSDFNAGWVDNGDKRSVSFSNLDGGEYTLQVKCVNADGVWSKPASIKIIKYPHLIQTGWFRFLAALLISALIVLYIRLRIRALRKQKQNLENTVELRTSQYKSEKERAERSEKFKEEFLANMSHEIRTPMNAVVGLTNLLLKTRLDDRQKNYLDAIRDSSENLMVILNDILDLSKIEAGKLEFENIEFSLQKVLKNVEDILHFKAEEKSLYLKTEVAGEIQWHVIGDPTRLNQVLMNLAGNAIKFTEKEGVTIIVELIEKSEDNVNLLFRVIDTGIGIPAERQNKIFESFEQADAETTRKFGGTGLGLSISKKLVEMQGGKIGVKSEPGKGAEFYFNILYKIPVHKPEKAAAEETTVNPEEFNGISILLVEDNEFNQMVAVDTLLEFNSQIAIDVAENGNIALEKLKRKKFDVILMDIQMPELNGYEATARIRSSTNGINKRTPIIAMTANASKMEIDKCFAADMNEYVSKPFDPVNLFRKISKVLVK